jgi:hypothetical protein
MPLQYEGKPIGHALNTVLNYRLHYFIKCANLLPFGPLLRKRLNFDLLIGCW